MSDIAELPGRILKGDKRAEAEFVSHFSTSVRLILERRTQDRELALDLTQDTLLTCIEQFREEALEDPRKTAHYVHRVAVFKAANANRSKQRRATDSRTDFVETISSNGADPLAQLTTKDSAEAVRELLTHLKVERDRDLLIRYFLKEQTKLEICDALEITPDHFDRVLYRAKQRFKSILERAMSARPETFSHLTLGAQQR